MNLRQERLLSRRSQLGRERFKCWNAWCSWHRQRHERGRYRCVALSLFTDPAVHHVRVQAMRQGHTTDAGPRLGTQGKYLCLELLAVFTPAWAVLIQRLFHRLHDPPSWGRCPLHAGSSRWDRRALTIILHLGQHYCPRPNHAADCCDNSHGGKIGRALHTLCNIHNPAAQGLGQKLRIKCIYGWQIIG